MLKINASDRLMDITLSGGYNMKTVDLNTFSLVDKLLNVNDAGDFLNVTINKF